MLRVRTYHSPGFFATHYCICACTSYMLYEQFVQYLHTRYSSLRTCSEYIRIVVLAFSLPSTYYCCICTINTTPVESTNDSYCCVTIHMQQ